MTTPLTLSTLRTQVRSLADMVYSTFVTDAEIDVWINNAIGELHDIVTTINPERFITSVLITGIASQNEYILPDDFLKEYKLFHIDSNSIRTQLGAFSIEELASNVIPELHNNTAASRLRYRILGNRIMLYPTPQAAYNFEMWYIPTATKLLKPTDTISYNLPECWSDVIICDAAARALEKEESDSSALVARKMSAIQRISQAAQKQVDAGDEYTSAEPDSVAQIIQACRVQSGVSFEQIKNAEIIQYINAASHVLYGNLVRQHEDLFMKSYKFNTIAGREQYPLPSDFSKLSKIYINTDGSRYPIERFMLQDIQDNVVLSLSPYMFTYDVTYKLMGGNLFLYPCPASVITIEIFYIVDNNIVQKPNDKINAWFPKGSRQFIIDDVVSRMLAKVGKDPALAIARAQSELAQISQNVTPRDCGRASRILMVDTDDGDF